MLKHPISPLLLLSALALAHSTPAAAATVTFKGYNSEVLHQTTVTDLTPYPNVGELTLKVLRDSQLPFEGDIYGIESIGALARENEVISAVEARLYGWCFSVDGRIPDTMPGETPVSDRLQHLVWFYAYAHYLNREWPSYCTPATRR